MKAFCRTASTQIREQMLVPDILWYEKSILGWFGQQGHVTDAMTVGDIIRINTNISGDK